ncbi:MAG: 16S rRNA pseudouridine(516) synthase [Gammaproteobacteria bacterium]|jgi:16S rRNA pseudouridine516 synthase
MSARRSRLDRLIAKQLGISRDAVPMLLARRRIKVDGNVVDARDLLVDGFSIITVDDQLIQAQAAVYLMLHKPCGVLSATKDSRHPVVTDLVDHAEVAGLHIAGRLDLHASGLLLLTNDGTWSRQLSDPVHGVSKLYEVNLKHPVSTDYVAAFAAGMYFSYENITTRPAQLEILGECTVRVTLQEGRYHQIKRMFGRFRNPVLGIHRIAIGNLALDAALRPGQWRELSSSQVHAAAR